MLSRFISDNNTRNVMLIHLLCIKLQYINKWIITNCTFTTRS
ncbi:hypothetical protein PROVRUST_05517 [Providencia rustigianii DSM 4541]|uniref:Uncharacterized protein n=1 Tax=Providencia rustigianii DSM 4541 TaxID=500637 RepID=D1P008_9GAMM|nr:hypothetical protein PROVRUST_05517 [Providencia rustigianii DSM 4541]